ncbi:IS5 family transposase [Streptomyces sp. NPDC005708]|uniref:IS5 family transposase n=1 Tax=Streptomyces sp. NPDC005708 TaxID=3154564 RepID=UPI003405795A
MTDPEWRAVEPFLPWPAWLDGYGGHPEEYCRRLVVDAICYVADNGNKWRNLPADYGIPWKTLHSIFTRWNREGFILAFHNDLREQVRKAEGREGEPSAGVIDSQSVRAAETVGVDSRGWDAGKKVGGRKRHVICDTIGLLLVVLVTAASVQDRDGARPALTFLRELYERITLVWADGGYAGKLVDWAREKLQLTLEIVKRSDDVKGFVVLPRRWVVEICQAQCTHGVCCSAVSAVSVQMRRLYQPGGRVRRSRSSASSRWSAWAMSRLGQRLSRRVVIQPRLIQA